MLSILITVLFVATFSCAAGRPVPGRILITSGNVDKVATTLSSTIRVVIYSINFDFRPGTTNEVLLEVPLIDPGELGPNTQIQITVGLDTTRMNTVTIYEAPHIGITDGTNENLFRIYNKDNNYGTFGPCGPTAGSYHHKTIPSDTRVPDQFTFLFQPYTKFGICSTAQLGGIVTPALFNSQLKVNAGISLRVKRGDGSEQYTFHYIKVEIVP